MKALEKKMWRTICVCVVFFRLNTSAINGNSSLLLPVGEDEDFVALYTAMGPYVDHVILVFEEPWIVVNSKTVLEINVKLSKHINLTGMLN